MYSINKNEKNFVVNSSQEYKSYWLNVFPEWEEFTHKILDRYIRSDSTYLDIGAWIGPTVLYGAQNAKHTFALEPDSIAFEELTKNLQLNPSINQKTTLIQKALGNVTGEKKLYERDHFGDSSSSLVSTFSKAYQTVQVSTIEDLVKEYNMKDLSLIKIDIEGGEYELIPAMKYFLSKNRVPIHLSLHPNFLAEHILNGVANRKQKKMTMRQLSRDLFDVLRIYPYIYDSHFNHIPKIRLLHYLNDLREPTELLLTNEKLH